MNTIPKRPVIRKLGTLQPYMDEFVPIVFKGRLYRFEMVRYSSNPDTILKEPWRTIGLRFVDIRNNTPTPTFALGHTFGLPFTEGDTMYVITVKNNGWGGETLQFYRSTNLVDWELYSEFTIPGWGVLHMNIAKMNDEYTLLMEIYMPLEECGPGQYTFRFAKSKDLTNWNVLPYEYGFFYEFNYGSPALYAFPGDEYYYVSYLESYPNERYATSIARSKDLINWEFSPINPVLMYDEFEDKKIASPFLTPVQRQRIANAYDITNNNMMCCEFLGRTLISYKWGDLKGNDYLAEAWYEGGLHEFLKHYFE